MSSADMISLIINKAKTKKLSRNPRIYTLRGISEKAQATELTKRINAIGNTAKLEAKNIKLRIRLY